MSTQQFHIPEEERLAGPELAALQRRKLAALLEEVRRHNPFYRRRFEAAGVGARAALRELPLLSRRQWEEDQAAAPPWGANLTDSAGAPVRLHQTSGSTGGPPLRVPDSAASWQWCLRCWNIVFRAAGLRADDRLLLPFSFGPFLGFWAAFDAAQQLGNLVIAGGGMTTTARLRTIHDMSVTVVCCTPTYALRLAEVAAHEGFDLAGSSVRLVIVAGEPGGSIPQTRARIEQGWGARVFDHWGMTEIGPLAFECPAQPGSLHLLESECIAEVIDPATGALVPEGRPGELVITNLGRLLAPAIRYRTGDQVCLERGPCACGRSFALARGGIIGRVDDMIHIRGNNVFPAALEAVVGAMPHVAEFRIEAYDLGPLTQVAILVEPVPAAANDPGLALRVAHVLHDRFSFRAEVRQVPPGTLPRFEMKARRFTRRRPEEDAPLA